MKNDRNKLARDLLLKYFSQEVDASYIEFAYKLGWEYFEYLTKSLFDSYALPAYKRDVIIYMGIINSSRINNTILGTQYDSIQYTNEFNNTLIRLCHLLENYFESSKKTQDFAMQISYLDGGIEKKITIKDSMFIQNLIDGYMESKGAKFVDGIIKELENYNENSKPNSNKTGRKNIRAALAAFANDLNGLLTDEISANTNKIISDQNAGFIYDLFLLYGYGIEKETKADGIKYIRSLISNYQQKIYKTAKKE
ncbi:MAG: hypothetical protein A2W93_06285 [Bacteroidetes bacterium GWF2_43_63]|nr:MAG: hypothetical protein A2W94_08250 [Bacteroidetes bacterium GWE2_42_42]OFY53228.1 MAG: hypothetical protein A2W93_06285 [Bacteroidetes bacterium GWF2_43_63]HBG71780.1 hypothetical protein [Bacteroidales bacterium]HCB61555.1 hypothetical protein [Bacteroidales bacterium]HCY22767.1 hypothetical protein [Bacteroidales bacterium]